MERARILAETNGTAVVLRTPHHRSLRFRSLDEATRWQQGSRVAVAVMLAAGMILVLLKLVLPTALFMVALPVVIITGVVVGAMTGNHARRDVPAPETLSWDESVQLDQAPHSIGKAANDAGGALACLALLAGLTYLFVFEGGACRLEEKGLFAEILAAVFALALVVGLGFGLWSAVQRVRFSLARRRINASVPAAVARVTRGEQRP